MIRLRSRSTLFPYTTLFRSVGGEHAQVGAVERPRPPLVVCGARSEEHTSELQSHSDLVCRLLLEKKKRTGARVDPFRAQNNRSIDFLHGTPRHQRNPRALTT